MTYIGKYSLPNILLIIIFSIILVLPIFKFIQSGSFVTHDGAIHILRIKEFYSALQNRNIPVRIAPNILGEARYPLFLINYQLPYLAGSAFLAIGFSAKDAYRILTVMTYLLYGLGAFLFFKTIASKIVA